MLPEILSLDNIWNESDDKIDEENSISNDFTSYSDNICFSNQTLGTEGINISILTMPLLVGCYV